jgi:hypothetical protein
MNDGISIFNLEDDESNFPPITLEVLLMPLDLRTLLSFFLGRLYLLPIPWH